MLPIEIWFLGEVCLWRHVAIIFWYIICLPSVSFIYLFLTQIHPLHPWTWITITLSTSFSLWFVVGVGLVVCVHVAHVWFSLSSYSVVPEIYNTRFEQLLSLFRVSRLPSLFSYTAVGILMAWSSTTYFIGQRFVGLSYKQTVERYNVVYVRHKLLGAGQYVSDIVYVNEAHLFLVLYGAYLGVVAYSNFFLQHSDYLEFPIMQKKMFERVKMEIVPLLNRCAKQTLQKLKYFYILYLIFGGVPRRWICHFINVTVNPEIRQLDSILGLFDMELLWQTLAFGMFTNICWSIGTLLVKVFHTEHYTFEIEHILQSGRDKCLNDALSSTSIKLLQYLGYLDVNYLSQFSPMRRKQVFSLSQPGGHPHIWNKMCSACLTSIDSLTSLVQKANWQAVAILPLKQPFPVKDNNFNTTADASFGSFLHQRKETAPNLSMSATLDTTQPPAIPLTKPIWKQWVSLIIKENFILRYIFNELPNVKSHALFASAQTSIWAIEALSYLAAASYREDQFGVVQRTLPNILTSLLTLHENVEKYSKLTSSVYHQSHKNQLTSGTGSLRYRLHSSLKSSIHRIVDTFGKHLMNVQLSPECTKILKPFMEMRNGMQHIE